MSEKTKADSTNEISRRKFMVTGSAVGAGLTLAAPAIVRSETLRNDTLNVAVIGSGTQGRVQLNACLNIPGIRFKAVCDIWKYNQRYSSRFLKKYKHDVNVYEDYEEMLATEKDIDAVLIASPDWMHAPHTNACLKAGKHVYCEKMMSNSLEGAASMVRTQKETGKLLQIGHQRRSNPRYLHAHDKLLKEANIFGRLTHANAQWNRGKSDDLGWPSKYVMEDAKLEKYGYKDMHEFRNWRWFKKYGGGPLSDLGAHQIDIFNWFFGTTPSSVMASGGVDYYKTHEWEDNVMLIYEYETTQGIARAFYQVLTTTSSLGFNERFMGLEGTLAISENPKWNEAFREPTAPEWDKWKAKGYLHKDEPKEDAAAVEDVIVDVRQSAALDAWEIPVVLKKKIHQPHLENFFDAIRKGTPLTCPAQTAFETAVTVKNVNKALASRSRYEFKPSDFVA